MGVCTLTHAQTNELLDFSLVLPPPPEQHVLVRPTVSWDLRVDAATHCASVEGHDGQGAWRQGCVLWRKSDNTCTIVTTPKTSHSVMGRLFMLCLSGGEGS